jgi:glycosyltransferase involved in cell wall biosynthesis
MKIAFVTIGDTRDIKRGSGTPYYVWQELLRQGHAVSLVGTLNIKPPLLTRFFNWLSKHMGKKYRSYSDPFMGRALGREAGRRLKNVDADFILTNDYCLAGYTPTQKPIILYTDAYFPRNYAENTHPWLAGLSIFSVFFSQHTTARGLKQAALCTFASQFAADEARKYPQTKGKPLTVIPYGANIATPVQPPVRSIENIKAKRRVDVLFIGKDWELKGGEIAVKVVQQLNQRGTPAHLHIAGVDLSAQYPHEYLTFYGLLNKDCKDERKTLEMLFQECDVLLVPSKAEGYGLVFVEAAAYGMPSLAYEVGGVTTSVGKKSGGALLPLSKNESDFTDKIEEWLQIPGMYESLTKVARETYSEEKNWGAAVSRLIHIVKSTLEKE